jgi:hypothetical protein
LVTENLSSESLGSWETFNIKGVKIYLVSYRLTVSKLLVCIDLSVEVP